MGGDSGSDRKFTFLALFSDTLELKTMMATAKGSFYQTLL